MKFRQNPYIQNSFTLPLTSQSGSLQRMVIRTVICPSFYAGCLFFRNAPHLPELGLGTKHCCPGPYNIQSDSILIWANLKLRVLLTKFDAFFPSWPVNYCDSWRTRYESFVWSKHRKNFIMISILLVSRNYPTTYYILYAHELEEAPSIWHWIAKRFPCPKQVVW